MLIYSTSVNNFTKIHFEPDFYELRLDLSDDFYFIPEIFLNKKTIITLRDKDEGGNYDGSLDKKLTFFIDILQNTDFYIDIELKYFDDFLKKIERYFPILISTENNSFWAKQDNIIRMLKRIIVSNHDLCKKSILPIQYLTAKGSFLLQSTFFFKYVSKIDYLSDLLKINNKIKKLNIEYVLMSTGKTALLSRLLYKNLGSKAVYFGKKGAETAENQITDRDVIRYNLKNLNKETKIGGILGGEQILNSLGLDFYNNYFQDNSLDAVYLPFIAEISELAPTKKNNPPNSAKKILDFLYFVKKSNMSFYGFSITMPCKKELPALINQKDEIINLWIPNKNEVFLTDIDAFQKSFQKLKITKKTKITLIGKGAMALCVKNLLPENDLKIFTRNSINNSDKYVMSSVDWLDTDFKCLINTTPLGMKGENVLEIFNIKHFDCVIDLPYSTEKTPLIEFCQKNKLPYVDGHEFWSLQAEKQLTLFLKEIVL